MAMGWLSVIWRRIRAIFAWAREEAFISRIYYESMRDNFEGYAWDSGDEKQAKTNALKETMLSELKLEFAKLDPLHGHSATLGQLFKIELALIWVVPEEALRARFWTIEDRFIRVVPTSVAKSYQNSFPAGSPDAVPEKVLRQRARNLLDVIHANYLINLAREKSIKRMMVILFLAASAIAGTVYTQIDGSNEQAQQGLLLIMAAGMAGGMISIIQRLQKATSRDAMVDDGIFELIGLRVGWLSVLMSIGIGGVFALFLYVLSAAHLLDMVLPEFASPQPGSGGDDANLASTLPSTADLAGALPTEDPTASNPDAASVEPANGAPMAATASEPAASGNGSAVQGTKNGCDAKDSACDGWLAQVTSALGFKDIGQYYKMVALGFISGFAERFVPDIINKLTKEQAVTAGSAGGATKTP